MNNICCSHNFFYDLLVHKLSGVNFLEETKYKPKENEKVVYVVSHKFNHIDPLYMAKYFIENNLNGVNIASNLLITKLLSSLSCNKNIKNIYVDKNGKKLGTTQKLIDEYEYNNCNIVYYLQSDNRGTSLYHLLKELKCKLLMVKIDCYPISCHELDNRKIGPLKIYCQTKNQTYSINFQEFNYKSFINKIEDPHEFMKHIKLELFKPLND